MGNGVKEGVVRLRDDAEPVLPAHVSSKASTPSPPWACSPAPSSVLAPHINHPSHTEGGGSGGDTGHRLLRFYSPVCPVDPAAPPLGKKSKPHPRLVGMSKVSQGPSSDSELPTQN